MLNQNWLKEKEKAEYIHEVTKNYLEERECFVK